MPVNPDPGSTLSTAFNVGALTAIPKEFADAVGTSDAYDYYRLSLNVRSQLNLALTGSTAGGDADLYLFNSTGQLLNGSYQNGSDEAVNQTLNAGTYYVRVTKFIGDTDYILRLSATPASPTSTPSNLLPTEVDLGSLSAFPVLRTGTVDDLDTVDVYRFSVGTASNFSVSLTGLTADLDLRLFQDKNGNGIVDAGEELARSQLSDTTAESIRQTLAAGNYFLQVYQYSGESSYTLNLEAPAISGPIDPDPGNTLATAEVQTSASFSRPQGVDASDRDDFYAFTVNQPGIFTASLTGLTGDADVRLIQDSNNNGTIDPGEIRAWQWERGIGSESIRSFLTAGGYFIQVSNYNNQTANYSLATNFTPATQDDRRFSIQLNLGTGLTGLTPQALNTITEAAQFWERVISHSSFNGPQVLTINVNGIYSDEGFLAEAGPETFALDANGRSMPTSGTATINTRSQGIFNRFPQVLAAAMRHEFGHILGLGTLWEGNGRNFINRFNSTYRANTYAGWAYGELKGTFLQTAIPVEPGVYQHWDESVFVTELMTPDGEEPLTPQPLSQMTIAALRDLGYRINYGTAEPYTLPVRT
jgi:hypothetical protein